MNPPIISFNRVTKSYKSAKRPAVKGLTFSISAGESVALLGPNGSGKTTTIKMIVGLLIPNSGSVLTLDMDPFTERRKLSHSVGLVLGNQSDLWNEITLKENMQLQAAVFGISRENLQSRIDETATLLGLAPLLDRCPRTFSTGEKMRAILMQKTIHRPKILILDEPTLGMDIEYKEEMRRYLRLIQKQNHFTILLTSHDLGDIEAISDRVMILNQGELVIDEGIDCIRNRPLKEVHTVTNFVPLERIILEIYKDMRAENDQTFFS